MQKKQVSLAAVTLFAAATFFIPTALASSNSEAPTTVTVHAGDTLWKIAHHYGVSVAQLEAANPSVNAHDLLIGTVLKMPLGSAPKTADTVHQADTSSAKSSKHPAASSNSTTTQQNIYWLAHVINAEAGNQSLQAQIAVGDVVMHRMESAGTGATVKKIVFTIEDGHYQFTCAENGWVFHSPSSESQKAADLVYQSHEDVVPGAYVFYAPASTPSSSWVRTQPVIKSLGNLTFAK